MNKPKINLIDYTIILGLILIMLVGVFILIYYNQIRKDSCISNPFVFGIRQLEEKNGVEIIGYLTIKNHPEISIYLDNTNLSIFYLDGFKNKYPPLVFFNTSK